jgi:hypothetical protein
LKLAGGVPSSAATVIGGVFDAIAVDKSFKQGYSMLGYAYVARAFVGIVSGTASLIATFAYVGPFIGRVTGRTIAAGVITNVGLRASGLLIARLIGMVVGAEVAIGLFVLQVIVWQLTPDALEIRIDHSAFGKKRETGGYETAKAQREALDAAIKEVGLP